MKTVFLHFLVFLFTISLYAQGEHIKIDNFKSDNVDKRNVEIWLPDEYKKIPVKSFLFCICMTGRIFLPAKRQWVKAPGQLTA